MTDAAAQAAMKRAIQIDAIANLGDAGCRSDHSRSSGGCAWKWPQFSKQEQRLGSYAQTLTRKRRHRELMRLRAIDLATAGAEMKSDEQRGGPTAWERHRRVKEKLRMFYYE